MTKSKIGFIGQGETVRGTVARGCRYFEIISYNLNSFCKQSLLKQHSRNMKVNFHFHSLVQVKKGLL